MRGIRHLRRRRTRLPIFLGPPDFASPVESCYFSSLLAFTGGRSIGALGANRVQLFQPRSDQRSDVHPGEADAALIPALCPSLRVAGTGAELSQCGEERATRRTIDGDIVGVRSISRNLQYQVGHMARRVGHNHVPDVGRLERGPEFIDVTIHKCLSNAGRGTFGRRTADPPRHGSQVAGQHGRSPRRYQPARGSFS